MIIDSHVHIGKKEYCENIIQNSRFKDIYKLYSSINPETVLSTKEFLKTVDQYFAIPLFFRETDISQANKLLVEYTKHDNKAIPVLLIPTKIDKIASELQYNILKEHFILHNPYDISDRVESYEYLNCAEGFILLHTLSKITVEYVKYLRQQFPKIKIIIAHLGRNANCNFKYTKNIIDAFYNDSNIYTDISTIENSNLINYAVKKFGSQRVLYGSDFPFGKSKQTSIIDCITPLEKSKLLFNEKDNILYNNANNIIKLSRKRSVR